MTAVSLRTHDHTVLGLELPGLLDRAKAAGLARLEIDLIDDGRIVAVWPPAEPLLAAPAEDAGNLTANEGAAEVPDSARDQLGWHQYAPELRAELKGLAARFPPEAVADAAARLAELIAVHGPGRPRQAQQ